jgi:hypothetical protein
MYILWVCLSASEMAGKAFQNFLGDDFIPEAEEEEEFTNYLGIIR